MAEGVNSEITALALIAGNVKFREDLSETCLTLGMPPQPELDNTLKI